MPPTLVSGLFYRLFQFKANPLSLLQFPYTFLYSIPSPSFSSTNSGPCSSIGHWAMAWARSEPSSSHGRWVYAFLLSVGWVGLECTLKDLLRGRTQQRMLIAEMATTATTATTRTTMATSKRVLEVLKLVTPLVGCGEVDGKGDEDTIVTALVASMVVNWEAVDTLGRDDMTFVAMERLVCVDMKLFAPVAIMFRLDVETLLMLNLTGKNAGGFPKRLVTSASLVRVVRLGPGPAAQGP